MMLRLQTFSLLFILLYNISIALEVGDRCKPNEDFNRGVCKVITDCEPAVRAVETIQFHTFLRCGFREFSEVVCCPIESNRIGTTSTKPTTTSTVRTTTTTTTTTTENPRKPLRVADRECKKIIQSSLPPLDLFIIGGTKTQAGEFPHMVALGYERAPDEHSFLCGGSLISDYYVVTAAHCVSSLQTEEPTIVRVGVVDLKGSRFNSKTDVRIAEIRVHPEYKAMAKYHDIALLRLERPLEFDNNLNAICLYTSNEDPKSPLTITGWGVVESHSDLTSSVLLKTVVSVVPTENCSKAYAPTRALRNGLNGGHICAGDPGGMYDACQGDSGGPLQGLTSGDGRHRLVGITSFGRGCGTSVPGVYTRISYYLDWIESVVWPSS